ncbi:MAG TPA: GNAT family N-acetyltransferase [Kofleriaceae bacterium]|nr:GNAT family N-acetyltransferase [Kofleriaceae bacterium]
MIETARLVLRDWREEDIPAFAAMCADPEVMRYFPKLLGYDEASAMARRIRANLAREGWGLWAVEVTGGAPFIGFVGLSKPEFRPDENDVEIGWRLARSAWGHGYATEAARAALAFGFDQLALSEIVSFTVPANVPSQRVMERLGMRRDPSADFEHPNVPEGSPLRLHWLWRKGR